MISLIKIFFYISCVIPLHKADSINIEQLAFNDFILQADSILMYDHSGSKYFQKDKHVIYFSGKTDFHAAMPYALNQISKKEGFILIDSSNDLKVGKDRWVYPLKGAKKINVNSSFVVIDKENKQNKLCKPGDLRVFMSTRYFHNGFYYVRFYFSSDTQTKSDLYIKLDKNGNVVDRAVTSFIF
jgi:hypothetical protein